MPCPDHANSTCRAAALDGCGSTGQLLQLELQDGRRLHGHAPEASAQAHELSPVQHVRHEVVSGLFFEISLYNSYDNEPAAGGTSNDWGIVTSLGYTF